VEDSTPDVFQPYGILEDMPVKAQADILSPEPSFRPIRGIQQTLLMPNPGMVLCEEPRGAVFTRRWVVELLLDLAGYRSDANLVDAVAVEPAAGAGAFLGPMIDRLIESCRTLGKPLTACAESIAAWELNEESAVRARMLVTDRLRNHGADSEAARYLASRWVRTGDYLLEAMNISADFVIGNPPYVRLEDIPEETASLYRAAYPTMRGRADLYVAFFEAALCQLKPNAACAFICADRWMRNQYGADLRGLITSGYAVELVMEMHRADAFDGEVDAYPAITLIRRREQASTLVASAAAEIENAGSPNLSNVLLTALRGETPPLPAGLNMAVVDTWFRGTDPWPCNSPVQLALLRDLEVRFPALESTARVGIGVATGNDSVFITKDANLVEPSRLLKLGMAGDITEGSMKWSGNYLVDPWDQHGLVELDHFPMLREYFEKHAAQLKRRHTAARNLRGWYKTIDRVTHSLSGTPKLYVADIRNRLDPVLDTGETYPHHNLYFIQSDIWDLEVLGGLLMSDVGQFFIESYGVRMRGGYLRFQAQYLRRIRVPLPHVLSGDQADALRTAFRSRSREAASRVALQVYGIEAAVMETALGSR
jgi:hypothetical protein